MLWTWGLIAVVCAGSCAVARSIGKRLDDAEKERSRRQWELMCEALGAVNLTGDTGKRLTTSERWPRPDLARETVPSDAVR